jgi:antitoxin component YwqK of YwqJK toxin-antitoxin module
MKTLQITCLFLLYFHLSTKAQTDTTLNLDWNGNLESKYYNKDGKIYGFKYFPDGKLDTKMVLNPDSTIITFLRWDKKGILIQSVTETEYYQFVPEKALEAKGKQRKWKFHGHLITTVNGKLAMDQMYSDGWLHGPSITYNVYTKGEKVLLSYLNYKMGKPDGECRYYTELGVLDTKMYFENGCLIKTRTFDATGKIKEETTDKQLLRHRYRESVCEDR